MIDSKEIQINKKSVKLTDQETENIHELATQYYEKIKRMIKNQIKLIINIKTYHTQGKRKKYSINTQIKSAINFESDASEWDLTKTMHEAMKKIISEIEHQLHVSDK